MAERVGFGAANDVRGTSLQTGVSCWNDLGTVTFRCLGYPAVPEERAGLTIRTPSYSSSTNKSGSPVTTCVARPCAAARYLSLSEHPVLWLAGLASTVTRFNVVSSMMSDVRREVVLSRALCQSKRHTARDASAIAHIGSAIPWMEGHAEKASGESGVRLATPGNYCATRTSTTMPLLSAKRTTSGSSGAGRRRAPTSRRRASRAARSNGATLMA